MLIDGQVCIITTGDKIYFLKFPYETDVKMQFLKDAKEHNEEELVDMYEEYIVQEMEV
jgi:bifunctional DNA-binding transcriptional regulator/antitoxin component of YhaV-PrlF toxin-antitoxin module